MFRGGSGALWIAIAIALATAGPAHTATDFNGDGRQDIAAGSYLEGLYDSNRREGAAHVLYGSRQKLRIRDAQLFSQDTPRIRERAEVDDRFGRSLAGGDFNGDGRDDLAIGALDERLQPKPGFDHGVVHVIYGRGRGLIRRKNQLLHQDKRGIIGKAEAGDDFGTVEAGDFDGDGRDDLAIAARGENGRTGAVHVLYGGRKRLRRNGSQFLTQNSPKLKGDGAEEGDLFGFDLEAGDFDGDGRDDLAIGAPREDIGDGLDEGVVHVLRGSRRGLTKRRDRLFSQSTPGVAGEGAEIDDGFGTTLAAGDFDRNGRDDLAVGAPSEDVPGTLSGPGGADFEGEVDAGAVNVLYGSRKGVRTRRSAYFPQGHPKFNGDVERRGVLFGDALAAGDLDRDRRDDLAIGASFDTDSRGNSLDGSVQVLFSRRSGVAYRGNQRLTQLTPGIRGDGTATREDVFGETLAIADLNGKGPEELLIGEPQNIADEDDGCGGGGLHVLYPNRRENLLARGYQWITQDTPGMPGDGGEPCDSFPIGLEAG